jgi:carboxyl-terminal processing protease
MLRSFFLFQFLILSSFSFSKTQQDHSDKRFEQLELFNKVLHLVENQYYRSVSSEKLIEGAIKGMLETLDPHSSFLNKEFFEKMQNDTQGEFGGLGLEVTAKDGVIYIITPIEDTPAFKAGIQPRDKLVEINHEPILGMTLEQTVEKMKGKIGEPIHLGVMREGYEGIKHFNLVRELIKVKPVKFELISDKFAYIRLIQFQKRSTENVVEALNELKKKAPKNLEGIILDLRSNPGGLLDQAVDISSIFLNEGIVVSTEARDPQNKDIRYVKKSGYKDLKTPLIVLINGASASASEIVAGALQDYKRAIIMGSQSFGKGSVQTVAQIDESVGVKLTIAQYMTPKNRKIQAIGIKPDVKIEEVDQELFEKTLIEDRYIREKDLRNHLVSTIESEDEKRERVEEEKSERLRRIKELDNLKKNKTTNKKTSELIKNISPKDDYQVIQAVRYLEGLGVIKDTLK